MHKQIEEVLEKIAAVPVLQPKELYTMPEPILMKDETGSYSHYNPATGSYFAHYMWIIGGRPTYGGFEIRLDTTKAEIERLASETLHDLYKFVDQWLPPKNTGDESRT